MKDKTLVSRHTIKTLREFIEKEYGSGTDEVWRTTIKQYKMFAKKIDDYGGKRSPHVTQINDAMFLLAFCSTAPKEYTIEELEPLSFELFMSSFNTLGRIFTAKKKWTMDLLAVVFRLSLDQDNKHAKLYPADFHAVNEPYDRENRVVKYCFTRCPIADFVKENHLGKWMPLMCNCDHMGLGKIHAGLIREGTCYTGDKCDYCIVSEDNALMQNYVLVRNEDGLLVSRKRSREEI